MFDLALVMADPAATAEPAAEVEIAAVPPATAPKQVPAARPTAANPTDDPADELSSSSGELGRLVVDVAFG